MKHLILTMSLCLVVTALSAQQDALFTHYSYNTLAVNPAYAGSRDALTATALHRSQWVDFPGAPVTQTFTIHGPAFDDKLGLGFSVVNDKAGPVSTTSAYLDATYRLRINKKSRLGIGLKAGMSSVRGDFATIELDEENDGVFGLDEASQMQANFGIGLYYHRERFYAGLSTTNLLENESLGIQESGAQLSFLDQQRHYYFITGAVFTVNHDLLFKPTTFVKMVPGAPIEVDVTAVGIYRERIEFGAMYRTGDAAGILAGFNVNEQLHLGYSFDWSFINSTFRYNAGSHEVMMRYDFVYKRRRKIKSPRYF